MNLRQDNPILRIAGLRFCKNACVLLALLALGLARPARAVEFVSPPGMNIPGQEQLLKEKVQRLATDVVGAKLVGVEVHIGYLKAGSGPAAQGRVKLPGFNNFITPETDAGAISPAFSRVRQVFIMVDETFRGDVKAIEQQIRVAGQFDPSAGDWVKVILVPAPNAQASKEGDMAQTEPQEPEESKEPPAEPVTQELPPQEPEANLPRKVDMVSEAKSTSNLIKARRYFFKGQYELALDQILQSIHRNPNNPQAYTMLGSLYYAMNWKALAVKYWEKALELDPDNKELNDLVARMR